MHLAGRAQQDVPPDRAGCLLQPADEPSPEDGRATFVTVARPEEQPAAVRAGRSDLPESHEAGPQGQQDRHAASRDEEHDIADHVYGRG